MRTPLHELHVARGGKMVAFAGYEMPLHYAAGIVKEHLHTRAAASLFDVSHMGQIAARGDGATVATVATALEKLMPADLLALPAGRQRYALLTDANGGIIDDLMAQNLGDRFVLVVNAACKLRDLEYLREHIGDACQLELLQDRALLALQGPAAAEVLTAIAPDAADMKFMHAREMKIAGADCIVSRSGYTGEDGFEISAPAAEAMALAERLLADSRAQLAGLGARDSLRLEAGLCLYGNDISAATTPAEAGLNWAVAKARCGHGERAGGFPGADVILAQMPNRTDRIRVGLWPEGRAPVRAGAELFAGESAVGEVTSGAFSPTLRRPIAMGYVARKHVGGAGGGAQLHAFVRGKPVAMTLAELPELPFVAHRYHR